MKKVVATERVPIKMWLDEIETGAMKQAKNLANLPFVFKHVAIMPDSHEGYGMPIGGVLATKGVVVPNAVGVDIGCGMCALRTDIQGEIGRDQLQEIVNKIKEKVPVGFNHHKEAQDENLMPPMPVPSNYPVIKQEYNSALKQLGTLGGGNHFIEIQLGDDGYVWIMIHSGSRNLGKKIADHYNRLAAALNELYFSQVEKKADLAFLPIQTKEAVMYMREMEFCVKFAEANRFLIMRRIQEAISEVIPFVGYPDFMINIAHNYARWEHHFNDNVIVHRKGATSARLGEIGIIPGSQGTKSYIVRGLGNPESFSSCSHGAGRKMGRKQAQRELNLEEEIVFMNQQNIIHDIKTIENLDEAAGAYKNIDVVMENQNDLVELLVELRPLAVIKG